MTCVSLFERRGGAWTLYRGMDPKRANAIDTFDAEDAALDAAKRRDKDVILVVESGETGGYTRKFERDGLGYAEV